MIVFQNVTLRYPYDETELLKGVSFTLQDGVNTILVDTQSGKSSLCKLLCKDVLPSSGEIIVDGLPISSITSAHLGILYLPSKPAFFTNRSVRYNIEYPLKVRKIDKQQRKLKAEQVASSLGIDCLDIKVKKLTDSDRRIVALARGLTVERKAVLFDDFFELSEDLDDALAAVKETIQTFQGATCVILTSDKRLAMGNTVVLDGGVTVYEGDADGAKGVVDSLEWLYYSIGSN